MGGVRALRLDGQLGMGPRMGRRRQANGVADGEGGIHMEM